MNNSAVDERRLGQPLPQRRAGHVSRVAAQQVAQLPQQRRHPSGGVEILHVAVPGGLQVHQHGRRLRKCVQSVEIDANPAPPGDGGQVDQRVGGAAQR
jgi:hypothetical protein